MFNDKFSLTACGGLQLVVASSWVLFSILYPLSFCLFVCICVCVCEGGGGVLFCHSYFLFLCWFIIGLLYFFIDIFVRISSSPFFCHFLFLPLPPPSSFCFYFYVCFYFCLHSFTSYFSFYFCFAFVVSASHFTSWANDSFAAKPQRKTTMSYSVMSSCHLLLGRPLDLFPLLGCHSVQCLVHQLSFFLAI